MRPVDRLRAGCAALLLSLSAGGVAESPNGAPLPPDRVIAVTALTLAAEVEAHRAALGDPQGVEALVNRVLLPHFDLQTSCRLMLHEHWRGATPQQRQRFVSAFYRYLLASHGDAVPKFRGDTIEVLPAAEAAVGTSAQVRTRMRLADGQVFTVDFYLRRGDRGWRIVDVIAEGISYVKTYRSDFGQEIRAVGLEALTARLEGVATRKP